MTPKTLVLHLLSVYDHPLEIAVLVRGGAVFGFEAGSVRVTVSRLQQAGHVVSAGRGSWRLSPSAARLAGQVGAWRELRGQVRPWDGGWLGIATGGLSRSDRAAVRRRDRALSLLGFRELRPGLQLRPDNRVEAVQALRARLVALGLEPGAPLFALGPLGPEQAEACALWDAAAIDARYAQVHAGLGAARDRVPLLPVHVAAREMFLAGDQVLRVLAFDPLLPAPIVDPAPRWALVDAMRAFDELGREVWARVLTMERIVCPAPPVQLVTG